MSAAIPFMSAVQSTLTLMALILLPLALVMIRNARKPDTRTPAQKRADKIAALERRYGKAEVARAMRGTSEYWA